MKYAHYDEKAQEILGYYDDEIHENIPEPNFQISDEGWRQAIDEGANFVDVKKKKLYRVEPEIDKKALQISELESEISETRELIRSAILIGNDSAIPELREEYKGLLAQKQALEKGDENEKEN